MSVLLLAPVRLQRKTGATPFPLFMYVPQRKTVLEIAAELARLQDAATANHLSQVGGLVGGQLGRGTKATTNHLPQVGVCVGGKLGREGICRGWVVRGWMPQQVRGTRGRVRPRPPSANLTAGRVGCLPACPASSCSCQLRKTRRS